MKPALLSQKSTVMNGTPASVNAAHTHSPVIEFPSTPPFAKPRKRGRRPHIQLLTWIASNRPRLLEDIEDEITNSWWDGGVSCGWLAKMYQLSIDQAEAVVWVILHQRYGAQTIPVEIRQSIPLEIRRAA